MLALPSLASADQRWGHYDNRYDRDRYVRREVCENFDYNISLRDVPRHVLYVVDRERQGRPIEAVQYVRRDGKIFYRFRIDGPGRRDIDMNLRVTPDGRILSVEPAGPELGRRW